MHAEVMAPRNEKSAIPRTPSVPAGSTQQTLLGLYQELGRYGNPFPHLMIYFPHLVGTLFAAACAPQEPELSRLLVANIIFYPASAVLHGLGCTWNDVVDEPLDRLVERTRNRPLPRGAITRTHAVFFYVVQTLLWLGMLYLISARVALCGLFLILSLIHI